MVDMKNIQQFDKRETRDIFIQEFKTELYYLDGLQR